MPRKLLIRLVGATALAAACLQVAGISVVGATPPPAIAAKQAQAQRILDDISAIDERLNTISEQYDGARVRLSALRTNLKAERAHLDVARARWQQAQRRAARLLVWMYTSSHSSAMDVILGADSLTQMLRLSDAEDAISKQAKVIEVQTAVAKHDLELRVHRLEVDRASAASTVKELAKRRQEIVKGLDERRRLLAKVEKQVQVLEAKERARQARLAAIARKRLAAELAARAKAEAEARARAARQAAAAARARAAAAAKAHAQAARAAAVARSHAPSPLAASSATALHASAADTTTTTTTTADPTTSTSTSTAPAATDTVTTDIAATTTAATDTAATDTVASNTVASNTVPSNTVPTTTDAPVIPAATTAPDPLAASTIAAAAPATIPYVPPAVPNADLPPGHPEAATIALKYLGVPYIWGGSTPSGFDCSGLVSYVYAQVGVRLPHFAAAQWTYGTPVTPDQLQPGDLVFFDALNHVGIYIGNRQFVAAPHTGSFVKIDSLDDPWYASKYVGARRI